MTAATYTAEHLKRAREIINRRLTGAEQDYPLKGMHENLQQGIAAALAEAEARGQAYAFEKAAEIVGDLTAALGAARGAG